MQLNLKSDCDTLLLEQMVAGCKRSFNVLYEKYWEKAYIDAYKRLKDTEVAKDVVQEIFTHIWIHKDTLRINNLPGYLFVSIRNKVVKHISQQKLLHPFFNMLDNIPQISESENDIFISEFLSSYEELLKSLPPKRQAIFRLHYQDNIPTKIIAMKLGIKRKTVQNQLGKAVESLKVSLLRILILSSLFLYNG